MRLKLNTLVKHLKHKLRRQRFKIKTQKKNQSRTIKKTCQMLIQMKFQFQMYVYVKIIINQNFKVIIQILYYSQKYFIKFNNFLEKYYKFC
ncbi:hypothetical protein IMG5_076480 [Ichthyophthirius multifiliis]|uniref:Uncharacterized protein n=1 Tax=Ichthyophthirius multifiliis TaxID=5932 RepID=G0QQB7_ICHMU|nr:hypothetical protein IMG5_076480 [Ichthyophthirius multifiliis]EGR32618.1 hypothetical protein IMG5_076480 [Ichthyophthirius multifiliis]|eukprot:XP_004036604.1 hypothetical protein IMG5_076480 [Ichthyophthirius multifiliis]